MCSQIRQSTSRGFSATSIPSTDGSCSKTSTVAAKGPSILFEVNLSGEPQKHGATTDGLRSMLEKTPALRHIKPVGLMTVPPLSTDPERTRPYFRRLAELLRDVNREFAMEMPELSMGMSADFAVAIAEGATMVRVGTAIFGERV